MKCPPGCTCGRHNAAKCEPGCTCRKHSLQVQGRRITALRAGHELDKGPRWIEDETTECWIWQWGVTATGYASPNHRRALYVTRRGPISRSMDLNHLCGVRLCVNPDHQVPLTRVQHAALHAILRRQNWMELPVPLRIAFSRSILEGGLVRT